MKNHNSCGLCRIELDKLTVKSGGDTLLDQIDLEFHCGQLTALIGRNGAGKTTLLKALLGERAYTGQIRYLRHDATQASRPVTGYVPQQLLFDKSTPVSVMDFMLAGKGNFPVWLGYKKEMRKKALVQLEKMKCVPVANRRLGELSGGELQRVMLAMALDPLPDLLILDEPVSGMDQNGLDLFYKLVSDLRDHYHIAIILVSHDLSLIRKYADRVVLLDKTVAAQGETEKVFQTEAFQAVFGYLTDLENEKTLTYHQ